MSTRLGNPDLRQRFGSCMLMPEAEDAFRLNMDLYAEDVIDEASLYGRIRDDHYQVGLACRFAAVSNTFQGEEQFDDSFLVDGRVAFHDSVQETLSAGHANLDDADCVAVVKDARVGMEPQDRLVAADRSDVHVGFGAGKSLLGCH